jgi:polyphenol oxidase
MIKAIQLETLPGVRHAFFSRRGGVSEGLFTSLNCGFGSGDGRANVAANRARAMRHLGLGADRLATVYQIHSANVICAEDPWDPVTGPRGDGLVTRRRGLAVGVLSADCAPVLFADAGAGVVGAAHGGWKGALGGVMEATVEAMGNLGARAGHTVAAVGPCIHQASYEVGPEFHRTFADADPDNARFFLDAERPGHYLFDLPGFVAERLRRLGLAAVEVLDHDTCADEERFFSYRRATKRREPDYGRGLSAIALED